MRSSGKEKLSHKSRKKERKTQNIKTRSRTMITKVVSSAEPVLHLCSKPNQSFRKPVPENISSISFSSQVTKSRISIRNPSGRCRSRAKARIEAFYAPAETTETLYEVLGITETESNLSDIKKAYKQMARMYHPDVSPPDRVDEYTRRFIMVHEAYETLSNPQSRALYDRDLAGVWVLPFLLENLINIIRGWRKEGIGKAGGSVNWMS
ncbi:hypothetical protein Pfo_007494 [Paulownia fortunei]|nr:hypothetical protein Pfo_007494 [Paulownia fortunei]